MQKDIIDFDQLMGLLGFENYDDLKDAHYKWVNRAIQTVNRGKKTSGHRALLSGAKRLLRRWKEPLALGQEVER